MSDKYKFTITGTDKTRKMFSSLKKNLGGVGKAMKGTTAKIGALVGVGGMAALVKTSLAANDALAKTADKLGIATEALGGLHHAAQLSGVSTQNMDLALQRMTRRVSEAANGTGSAVKALKELGLDAKALANSSPDQVFMQVTKAMEGVENQSDKVRLAFKLFDSGGVGLVNTMSAGADALRDTMKEAEILGATLNRIDAAKIEQANDAMHRSGQVAKGFGNAVTVAVSPYIEALGNHFYNSALEAGGFGESTNKAMSVVVSAVGYTANVIRGLQVVFKVVKLAAATAVAGVLKHLSHLDAGVTKFLNYLPGVEAETSGFLNGMSKAMHDQTIKIKDELVALANEPLPHNGIVAWAAEVERKAEEVAVKIAETKAQVAAPIEPQAAAVATDEQQEKDKARKKDEEKTKSNEDKMVAIKVSRSKKLAKLQEAIRLKQLVFEKAAQLKIALGEGYVAVQKAWASAPFPVNIPAVAAATAGTALNVAAITGLETGGPVGNRSIVEVGERNKPEVLTHGGKNYLLGGNGGAVFNRAQLDKAPGGVGGSSNTTVHYNPTINAIDATGVADLLEEHQEVIYNLVAGQKNDMGEAF